MADPEHLKILNQGVKAWNQWREDNPEVIPDFRKAKLREAVLSEANLSEADLSEADLFRTTLRGANLSGTILREAMLMDANLHKADLSKADLRWANLCKANLDGANLTKTNLRGATFNKATFSGANLTEANLDNENLCEANLRHANLANANLSGAHFIWADLSYANLTGAILSEANLSGVHLFLANLSGADLSGADLSEADLNSAECQNANFSMAILSAARLLDTTLDGATLTGACLWETQRAGWSIKGVICEYIYWDEKGDEESVYRPGEFEKFFADKTKVRLFYRDGINPLEIATIPALIKHLEDSHPGSDLRLVSIKEDSGGVVVELAIEGADNKTPEQLQQLKAALETEAQQRVEYQRQALIEREARLQLEGEVRQLSSVVDKLILRQSIIVNQGGVTMGNETYQNYGQTAAQGHNAHAHDNTFNQVVNHFDLPALAKQLGELREEMAKRGDSSPQAVIAQGEAAKAEMAAKAGDTSKVIEHLKSAGEWTLDFAKEIGKDLVVEAIKLSMGMP